MQIIADRDRARAAARVYEAALPTAQRKMLGQFFTGVPLGKLLAHIALDSETATVLDPMAGHGDLLDATWEAANDRGIAIERLDGIEIDARTASVCRDRLSRIFGTHNSPLQHIFTGSAFDLGVVDQLSRGGYDLVITNPPYVRYQVRKGRGLGDDTVRSGLEDIANDRVTTSEKGLWRHLIKAYSGLSDLSIPSWLLAGLLVRPGGRLALVAPATWRSRDYADPIRYMLLRCFDLEYIVEDTQPGWFSDALVRTHLVVARRLPPVESTKLLSERHSFSSAEWVQVAPEAAGCESLVGSVFDSGSPEADLARWLRNISSDPRRGIHRQQFEMRQEWESLESRVSSKSWYLKLEGLGSKLRHFKPAGSPNRATLPDAVRDIVIDGGGLSTLEDFGIQVGQGLRTGCNQFFYVTVCHAAGDDLVRVAASPEFEDQEFDVPESALRTVLRRQSEVPFIRNGQTPPGRALDLRGWVLPEDAEAVAAYLGAYCATGEALPKAMPAGLADFVRLAAVSPSRRGSNARRIPELSAVRPNARIPRDDSSTPRFWYMLPDFTPRHLPAAFVARVNHNLPWVEVNLDPPVLIDANFSSIWSTRGAWTRFGLKAMLNSVWCRTLMEALGTPMGGGALKLDASHIRRMPIPQLSEQAVRQLNNTGRELTQESSAAQVAIDDIVLRGVMGSEIQEHEVRSLASNLDARSRRLHRERRRMLP